MRCEQCSGWGGVQRVQSTHRRAVETAYYCARCRGVALPRLVIPERGTRRTVRPVCPACGHGRVASGGVCNRCKGLLYARATTGSTVIPRADCDTGRALRAIDRAVLERWNHGAILLDMIHRLDQR